MGQNLLRRHVLLSIVFGIFFSTFLPAQAPTVNCPITSIGLDDFSDNDINFWNTTHWWDPVINSQNLGESDIILEITATSHCPFSENLRFRYLLSLDTDRDNIFETFIDSDSLPAKNTIYSGNSISHIFSGIPQQFDTRPVNPNEKWGFDLAVESNGNNHVAQMIWKNDSGQIAVPQLPYGSHKIKWIVTDSCGQETICEYGFTIKDTQKPVVECLNGLDVFLMHNQSCVLQLWASDFLDYTEDNYTPSNQLEIAIRRAGTGTGFPYNSNGTAQSVVSFNYCDLGLQLIELWSKDKDGNTQKCDTYVLIQDIAGVCECFGLDLGGHILTENGKGVSNVSIELSGNNYGTPVFAPEIFTDTLGKYIFHNSLPLSGSAGIHPGLNLDPLNGVNTWDLILISRHILGLEPLGSPYKLISADANQSGTITTFDVVELRKLILGTYAVLPNNESWRFVDKNQVFSNPENPFADTLKENISFNMLYNDNYAADFVGCKIGDVDLTAVPNNLSEPEDRNEDVSFLTIQNRQVKKEETFTIHFDSPPEMAGFQFTLNTKGLKPVQIIPGPGLTVDHFGIFSGGDSDVFAPAFTTAIENGNATFEVAFTALTDGLLSDMLQISNDITLATAFEKHGHRRAVVLRFETENEDFSQPVLLQNTPNPWSTSTAVSFYLPEATEADLIVSDQNGRVIYNVAHFYPGGYHEVILNKNQFLAGGMYYISLKTATFSAVKKMVLIGW